MSWFARSFHRETAQAEAWSVALARTMREAAIAAILVEAGAAAED